jgi:sentrin-specific protease 1
VSPISADADTAMPLSAPATGGSAAGAVAAFDREDALAEEIEELDIGSEAWFASWRNKMDPTSDEYKADIKQLTEERDEIKRQNLAIEEAKAERRREEQKKIDDMRRIAQAQIAPVVVVDQNLLALEEDATDMVELFWDESLDDNELFCTLKKRTIEIKRCDMVTLKGLNWLNDNVINGYLSLIVERSQAGQDATPRLPKVWAPSTFFYSKLKDDGYPAVKRWTKPNKCPGGIFSHDIMIVPVHLKMHWACGFLDFRKKTIELYDSLGISETIFFKIMRNYIVAEAADKKVAGVDIDEWTDVRGDACPKQNNGSDCGMFSVKFADYRSRDLALGFGQRNMQYFRSRTAWELFQGRCLA